MFLKCNQIELIVYHDKQIRSVFTVGKHSTYIDLNLKC